MSNPEAPLPAFWQQAWDKAEPALQEIRARLAAAPFVPTRKVRVGQLDAELLDQELVTLLKEPVKKSIALLQVIQ
jgi:peroxin-2